MPSLSVYSPLVGVIALSFGVALVGCASGKPVAPKPGPTAASTATAGAEHPPTNPARPAPPNEAPVASSGYADLCASGDRAGCLTDGDYATQKGQIELAIRLYERGCDLGAARGCADAAKLNDQLGESDRAAKLRDRARTLTNRDR